jgi:hypothetical protein
MASVGGGLGFFSGFDMVDKARTEKRKFGDDGRWKSCLG